MNGLRDPREGASQGATEILTTAPRGAQDFPPYRQALPRL
jgi:hypothetical protein